MVSTHSSSSDSNSNLDSVRSLREAPWRDEPALRPTLTVRGLTKRFQRKIAVNEIDLDLHPGEIYGLIGPNGAGKTTLMEMIVGAEMPTLGEIWIDGESFRQDQSSPQIQRCIGFLPDDYPLYDDLTVWQYLEYFARLYGLDGTQRRDRLYDILELVRLTSKRHSCTTTLSRGMKQRLGLAPLFINLRCLSSMNLSRV